MRGAGLPLFALAAVLAFSARPTRAQELPPAAAGLVSEGDGLAATQQFEAALDAYRRADALANHSCAECSMKIVYAEEQLGDLAEALKECTRAIELAGGDRFMAADMHMVRGALRLAMAGDPADPKIQEAERDYRETLALNPKKAQAHFNLGVLLIQERREADGVAELRAFISAPLANPVLVDRAKRFLADPSGAREPRADSFAFKTIEGQTVSNDSLQGKVVLFDFWASWCPPCRASIPMIASLRSRFAGKPVEIVGINADNNETACRSFVAENGMSWPEYVDLSGQMQSAFQIAALPTFVILDRSGVIRFQQAGVAEDTPTVLEAAINAALERPFVARGPAATPAPTASAELPPEPDASSQVETRALADFTPLGVVVARLAGGTQAALVKPGDEVENGDASAGTYRNDFLGLWYTFPPGWIAASPDRLEQLNRKAQRWLDELRSARPDSSNVVPDIILYAAPDDRARLPFVRITVEATNQNSANALRSELERFSGHGLTILNPPQEIAIGKRRAVRTELQSAAGDASAWITSVSTIAAGRYRVTLDLYARSKAELTEIAATLRSFVISKP